MDFIMRLRDHLKGLDTFAVTIHLGTIDDDDMGDCITLSPAPSTPPSKYLNNDKSYNVGFQILVRHSNQVVSMDTTQKIADNLCDLLPKAIKSANGSFYFVKIDMNNTVNFVERDNRGWVYTCLFNANLIVPKGE